MLSSARPPGGSSLASSRSSRCDYPRTVVPPGRERLVGADASEAWASVFAGADRWVDFDPTNDVIPFESHVVVAGGRDFGDVTPLKGVILGDGEHVVDAAVEVAPLEGQTTCSCATG